ncbi:MAG: hypothetical protein APR63_09895 [Desulfuromonas sp. SDB]|nr:MAG: hypothetical protein APR63_09895 [Desulfuromonas sp. SDB]
MPNIVIEKDTNKGTRPVFIRNDELVNVLAGNSLRNIAKTLKIITKIIFNCKKIIDLFIDYHRSQYS